MLMRNNEPARNTSPVPGFFVSWNAVFYICLTFMFVPCGILIYMMDRDNLILVITWFVISS